MRIAYVAHGVHGRLDGVRTKILGQARMWTRLDPSVEVGLFVRCEAGAEKDWLGEPNVVKVRSSRGGIPGRLVERELLSVEAARWRPDLVYLRYSTVSPSVLMLAGSIPTVVELNTLDLSELRMRSQLRYRWAQATRERLLRRAIGLVVVAREIAAQRAVRMAPVPKVVIPNSIDLTRYEPLPPAHNSLPRLAFLGAPHSPWHGVDKIVRLAQHFPQWSFDLIGPGPDEITGDAPNVQAHGPLTPADYLPILARSDVAIGALALHRLDLSEASPLKVAEYLAYGIPAITGYTDTRFPHGAPFLLQLPNTDEGVESSVERIDSFVRSWMGRRVERASVGPIDSGLIERRRLDFLFETLHVAGSHAIA
jgi:glycosyltransferase involved in cell wall biosynthesis